MISLCTANFNKWPYLTHFLNSIIEFEATYISEIIIVDDCSTDNSGEIITERKKNNSSISVLLLKNEKNLWPWPSYDKAVRAASNEFIMLIDSDDFLIASSIEQKLEIFKANPTCNIVYWDGRMYDDKTHAYTTESLNTTFLMTIFPHSLAYIKEYFSTQVSNLYLPWALIKKDFLLNTIGWFDPTSKSNDRIVNIKIFSLLSNKNEIWYCAIPCFAYRIWNSNISHRYEEMELLMSDVAEKYIPHEKKSQMYANIFFTLALHALRNWSRRIAYQYLKKSLQKELSIKKMGWFIVLYCIPTKILNSPTIKRYAQKVYWFLTH